MIKLNELQNKPGSKKKKVRVGRGAGSGVGKTCGRGMKGQKSRSGVAIKGFEGGQMPMKKRIRKRGFTSRRTRDTLISLKQVYFLIKRGVLPEDHPNLTKQVMLQQKLIKSLSETTKLVSTGQDLLNNTILSKLSIESDKASQSLTKYLKNSPSSTAP